MPNDVPKRNLSFTLESYSGDIHSYKSSRSIFQMLVNLRILGPVKNRSQGTKSCVFILFLHFYNDLMNDEYVLAKLTKIALGYIVVHYLLLRGRWTRN